MKWIKVGKKYPKCEWNNGHMRRKPVIVCTKDRRVTIAWFGWYTDTTVTNGEDLPEFETDEGYDLKVTHWMDLPRPPRKKKTRVSRGCIQGIERRKRCHAMNR